MSFTDEEVERYARHLVLREIGGPGQQKLKAARVLIVGAGGLGAPAALYLAAAGVGTLGLVDADEVALSNLQRQVLYASGDVGRTKVEAAMERLGALNPHVEIEPQGLMLDRANAAGLVRGYDVVLDGTDSFETRFVVNAACFAEGKPLVSGAIGRWTGQLAVFEGRPCYRCLVPELPPDAETCSAVGVMGALAGVIGSMMALEAIKLITGAGETLAGRLLIYDALSAEVRTVGLPADPACEVCGQPPPRSGGRGTAGRA
jgi:molybdopterin/thiamine biosynthesis adenylyltransferase